MECDVEDDNVFEPKRKTLCCKGYFSLHESTRLHVVFLSYKTSWLDGLICT
jgi:hypothetical protein